MAFLSPSLRLPLFVLTVLATAGPWLWIAFFNSTKVSAWGTTSMKPFLYSSPVPHASSLTMERRLTAAKHAESENHTASGIWIPVVVTYLFAVSLLYLIKEPERWPE